MIRNPYRVGNDSQRWIDSACRDEAGGVNDIKVVEVMRLAVWIKDAGCGIVAHAAGAVLVADTLKRDALLEVCVERERGACVAGLLENVDPTAFEAIKGLDVIGRVGELNPPG